METKTLGRTGLEVTTLGYGAMELRGSDSRPGIHSPDISDESASALLNAVLDAGINFIDTSPDYGRSEEHIGRAIAHRRSEYYLASKCGCTVIEPGPAEGERPRHIFTAENVRAGVERSLQRMHTDYLDIVQFHASPSRTELEDEGALDELKKLQSEGKVRYLGMSGTLPNIREQVAMGVFDEFQIPYSALEREHEDVTAQAAEAGAGIVIRGGVARGAPTDWGRARRNLPVQDRWETAKLDDLLDGMSRQEFMLRFTLALPDLHTTIVGTSSAEHLADNLVMAAKGPLPVDVMEEAKRRLEAAGSRPDSPPTRTDPRR